MTGTNELDVTLVNRSGMEIDSGRILVVAETVLRNQGFERGELGITFVPSGEMERLNIEHLNHEGPTDVLSFPIDAGQAASQQADDMGAPVLLGDVVICPQVAAEQATGEASSFEKEICMLVIHGILHITGHNHEADTGKMESIQDSLLGEICGDG